jgi:dienelactone hydrolase
MASWRFVARVLCPFLFLLTCAALAAPAPRIVDLKAPDGTLLKATYFSPGRPGPGVLLLHACNQQRKDWDGLAEHLTAKGISVLTVDYRGYGESGGARFAKLPQEEENRLVRQVWPGDIDVAYAYLLAQPGVRHDMIGAGGASCGVNNSIQLARRHPEVKALMLLSGGTNRDGRLFLQNSKNLPVFVAGAEDDEFGQVTDTMQWLFSESSDSASRFQRYATGRHGAEMFGPHPELMDFITDWFVATLMNQPASLPKTNGARFEARVVSVLHEIDQPGGADKVAKKLAAARKSDPKAELFPESIVNYLGYEHIQSGDAKGAVEIMKLNTEAYPDSANVYDSLADAYVADGQKELAAQNAKKALERLGSDKTLSEDRRKAIRDSAEGKLKAER